MPKGLVWWYLTVKLLMILDSPHQSRGLGTFDPLLLTVGALPGHS